MVSSIKSAIVLKLKEMFPLITKRYTDDNVPQNFTKPSFFVSVIDQEYSKRINNKYKGLVSYDVAYFSDKGTADIKSDCLAMQEILLRGLGTVGAFRTLDKTARITDDVLHIMFNVSYSEMISTTETKMQTQETNINN